MGKYEPRRYIGSSGGSPTEQENRLAKRFGGKRVGGSGANYHSKGDVRDVYVRDKEFLIEAKQTKKASISVKWDWLKKISREAEDNNCEPALAIEIKGGEFDSTTDRDWVMIPARVFEEFRRLTK
jgi:hypothetical protein